MSNYNDNFESEFIRQRIEFWHWNKPWARFLSVILLCIVSLITLKRVTLCKLEKEWTRQVNSKGTTGNRYVNVLNTLIGVFSYHILLFNVVVVRFQKSFNLLIYVYFVTHMACEEGTRLYIALSDMSSKLWLREQRRQKRFGSFLPCTNPFRAII